MCEASMLCFALLRSLDRLELTNSSTGAFAALNYKSSLNTEWNSKAYLYPQSSYTYKVQLFTSDVPDADFDGDVYLTPSNWWSTAGTELKLSLEGGQGLKRGTCAECTLKLSDISFISTLGIRIVSDLIGQWRRV